jgi:hypothetical protein
MKILSSIKTSALHSLKSWKGVLIVWFSSVLLVIMVALPMKGALKSGIGSSMITEKLANGIDFEVFSDLGATFKSLASFFSSGFILVIFIGFLLNAFFTGGFFNSVRGSSKKFSTGEFFKESSRNFWSFLVITLLLSLIILIMALVVIGIPMSIVGQAESPAEGSLLRTGFLVCSIFFLILVVLFIVADYSRAWQVTKDKNLCFKAIGFGFSQTFRTFFSSFPLMIILIVIQALFGWLVISVIPGMNPVSGVEVFKMFLLSQLLFIIRIFLKVLRYGSVTALMEENTLAPSPVHLSENEETRDGNFL